VNNYDHKFEGARQPDYSGDDLDQRLDTVLAKYANAEPRGGLEERVLANLGTKQAGTVAQLWWRWSATIALATVVLAVLAISHGLKSRRADQPMRANMMTPKPKATKSEVADQQITSPWQIRKAQARRNPHARAIAVLPKLEQFPSPQPLSEQERILANYVAHFHNQAVLIARVNTAELQQDRLEMIGKPQGKDISEAGNNDTTGQ
jgi:hypothetical protein